MLYSGKHYQLDAVILVGSRDYKILSPKSRSWENRSRIAIPT